MNRRTTISFLTAIFLALAVVTIGRAQGHTTLTGVWQGTSICQVKNSPCHDEVVVYYITKGATDSSFNVVANKIVNGKEEDMGELHFIFDSKRSQLRSTDYNAAWTFTIDKNKMNGTLFVRNALYRIINLTKKE
jgi:hypothetical protein